MRLRSRSRRQWCDMRPRCIDCQRSARVRSETDGPCQERARGPSETDGPCQRRAGGPSETDGPCQRRAGGPSETDGPCQRRAGVPSETDGPCQRRAGVPSETDGPCQRRAGGPSETDGPCQRRAVVSDGPRAQRERVASETINNNCVHVHAHEVRDPCWRVITFSIHADMFSHCLFHFNQLHDIELFESHASRPADPPTTKMATQPCEITSVPGTNAVLIGGGSLRSPLLVEAATMPLSQGPPLYFLHLSKRHKWLCEFVAGKKAYTAPLADQRHINARSHCTQARVRATRRSRA
jgi:hypothetical protein